MKRHQTAKVNLPLVMVSKLCGLRHNQDKTLTKIVLELISKEIDQKNANVHEDEHEYQTGDTQ